VIAIAAGVEIARTVAILEAEAERIIGDLVFRRILRGHQQLHRADFLLGMLRQMVGVVAADEAGISLLAKRTGEHPVVECGGFRFVDAILGLAGTNSGE